MGSDISAGTVVRVVGRRVRTVIYAEGIRPVTEMDELMRPGGGMMLPGETVHGMP
jgi:hypothetical protein